VPVKASVPVPATVKLYAPLTTPPSVKALLPLVVTVGDAPKVTAPVPIFKALVPPKLKLPFQVWALLLESVTGLPEVLSMVPPEITKVPVPKAALLLMSRVPVLKVVVPL